MEKSDSPDQAWSGLFRFLSRFLGVSMMPCYLFTWHAYGTRMPDRPQGYVKSKQILPPNAEVAASYRKRQRQETARFESPAQQLIVEELLVASKHRRFRVHGVATDPTHVHVLMSWDDERPFDLIRRGARESVTRRLNRHRKRQWLSHRGSRKRVRDREHFDHLMSKYLPSHLGLCWFEDRTAE